MAFLLVQHLDPHFESRLADLLGKNTSMPVLEATDGLAVSPNQVYIIPPNSNLGIARGLLQVSPRAEKGPHFPIDHLFRALSEDQRTQAIGVVLSGTGSDGTLGLCEIKAVGGITFAQDERSARHSGMPRSAVESGCVDFVLDVEAIADRLADVGAHPYLQAVANLGVSLEPEGDEQIQGVLAAVRSHTGVDFGLYRNTTIRRRILRRMALGSYRLWSDYIQRLESDTQEVTALYRDLLINVTSFFRDPELFESLKKTGFPEIVSDKSSSKPVRIWVPGCSTGQEAYSLAIALLEFFADQAIRPPIQIFATDLSDPNAIEKARAGRYPKSIEAEVSAERLERFFDKEDHHYRIGKMIRDMCVFARQDVTADPPFSHIDLISCRNLLIYFAPPLQKRVLQTFHYALNQPGFLVLGPAETAGDNSDLFMRVDRPHRIYEKKATIHRVVPPFFRDDRRTGSFTSPHPASQAVPPFNFQGEADRLLLGRFAPPGVLLNENLDIIQFRGRTGAFLEAPPGEPTANLIKMAREGLFLDLRNALDEAKKTQQAARRGPVRMRTTGEIREVHLEVLPIKPLGSDQTCFLVLFQDSSGTMAEVGAAPVTSSTESSMPESADRVEFKRLRDELAATKEYLESIIGERDSSNEELRTANEEILSSNEELQSTNEELGTAKEELQSTNEELTTVNEQLQTRNLELVRVNDDLTNLLASIDIPVIMVGADLRIQRFTAPAKKFMSLLPTDVGRPVGDLKPAILVPDLEALIGSVIETNQPFQREVRDVNDRWYVLRLYPYTAADPSVEGAVIVLFDIDERRRAEELLRKADRNKDEFLATLGHELRNPLGSIHNATEILRRASDDPAAMALAEEILERQLHHLTRIVEDLVDVSRIVKKKIELHKETVALATIIESAVESSRALFEAREHRFSVSLPPEPIYLSVDRVRMSQVLINLFNNAAKFTERGGQISLVAERGGDSPEEIVLRVRDTGIGIPAGFLDRMFDIYVQGDQSLERDQGGLGIGLALARSLVQMHGGKLTALSDGPGQGSEFVIELALAESPNSQPAKKLESLRASRSKNPQKVFIVDDNADHLESLRGLLELMGHEVRVSNNASSALELIPQFVPDIALIDLGLPEMNGYDLAARLRQVSQLQATVFIAQTGLGQEKDRLKSKESGFDHHLVKPISLDHLVRFLDKGPAEKGSEA